MALNRRSFVKGGVLAVVGVAASHGAARAASTGVQLRHFEIPWPIEKRFRVVQISDVHVGWGTPKRVLQQCAEYARRARPDLTVLTGDYVNRDLRHVDRVERFARALPDRLVATLGNHDHWSGAGGVIDALKRGGARVLNNENFEMAGIPIVGVDDGFTNNHDIKKSLKGVDPARALILSHFPTTADEIAAEGGRLVLSGHTHGGQIVIPGLTQALSRMAGSKYLAGWYHVDGARLYVNAGCGQSIEGFRAGHSAMPEVAVFDLVPLVV